MKTQETTTPLMDEIVFEKRNKMYGAYILRKMYNKQLNKALLISIGILMAGLAYPIVLSYNADNSLINVWTDTGVVVITNDPPPPDAVIPPPPPPISEVPKRIVFTAPEVVPGEVPGDEGLPNQDIFSQTSGNDPIDLNIEKYVEKQVKVFEDPERVAPVIIVEEMPSYPGGDVERQRFLAGAIKYPVEAVENGIQGTVYVQFVVDSKGNITDAKIMRGIGGGCDDEALRVVKMMPPWHPGKQNGKAVWVLYTMSVSFKLQS